MKRNDRKRILAAVLCTVLAAGMTGCGKTTVKDAGSNPKESTPIEDAGYHYRAEWLTQEETDSSGTEFRNISVFNSHPRFPFCKRVSHFESDLQILYPTFHFCNDFPVFSLAFMI